VDDSPFMRKAIQRMLGAADDIEVIGTAATGEEALEALDTLDPHVVTLDVVLPGADGITVLERIMARHPLPVLMLSSLTTRDAETTLIALEKGAVDVVAKPVGYTHMDMPLIAEELISKVRSAAGVDAAMLQMRHQPAVPAPRSETLAPPVATWPVEALVVGASTGGPPALSMLVAALPADFPVPVLLVQHMPVGFTATFAERLDKTSELHVSEVADGDVFEAGRVFVARSGKHVQFTRRGGRIVLRLTLSPAGLTHMPSVDVAMGSAADVFGSNAIGVLLTGMGEDGARGLLKMRERGAYTIAESGKSAVIWGMPRVAAEIGAAAQVAALRDIPGLIKRHVGAEAE
jgi:two-component system chemotaxis response regulator CheB